MNSTSYQSTSYNHKYQTQLGGISGLKVFEGQDLTAGDRKRLQNIQSNYWYKQQIAQKQQQKNQEKYQKDMHDQQTLQINQYRQQLQEQKARRLREMQLAYKSFNYQQLQQKMNKQALQRKLDEQQRLNHIQYITGNDFYTENTQTCQSQLNKNRVKPYHWKGMSDSQKRQILEEQQKQKAEKALLKQLEKQQDNLFAQQMQAQRKAILLHERSKHKGLQDVRKGVDHYNKMKAEQMKRKAYQAFDGVHTYKNQA